MGKEHAFNNKLPYEKGLRLLALYNFIKKRGNKSEIQVNLYWLSSESDKK